VLSTQIYERANFLPPTNTRSQKLKNLVIAFLFLLSVSTLQSANAVTIYVDTDNGNDAWSGKMAAPVGNPALDGPLQSLKMVSSLLLNPGDKVLLKCGQTWTETLRLASNGTPANPILVSSYPAGCVTMPTINGAISIPSKSWAVHSGKIYVAKFPVDLLVGRPLNDGSGGWGVSSPDRDATIRKIDTCGSRPPPCMQAVSGAVGNTVLYGLFDSHFLLSPASNYSMVFRVKTAAGVRYRAIVRRAGPPWDVVGFSQSYIGTGDWATHNFDFSAATSLQNARLDIEIPGGRIALSVDSVQLLLRNGPTLDVFSEDTPLVAAHHPNVGHNIDIPKSIYLPISANSSIGPTGGSSYLMLGPELATAPGPVAPGQTIRIRSSAWRLDERVITSVTGNAVNLDRPTSYPLVAGYGYYLTGARWMLDEPGEWFFDQVGTALYAWMPDGLAPQQRVSLPFLPAGIDLTGRSNIIVDGIAVRRTIVGVVLQSTTNVVVRKSSVLETVREGFDVSNALQSRIEANSIVRTGGDAIARAAGANDLTSGMLILNNKIAQSGVTLLPNGQLTLPVPALAAVHAGPNATVSGNTIGQTSSNGLIATRGTQVSNNTIQYTCMLLDDCGGIYVYGASNASQISNNFVKDIEGNPYGKPEEGTHVVGIYLDELTSGAVVSNNVVANADHGIQLHNAASNQVLNNTLYANRKFQLWLQEGSRLLNPTGDLHSNVIRGNMLFPEGRNPALSLDTKFSTTVNFGVFDMNVYSALNSANVVREKNSSTELLYQFPAWQQAKVGGVSRQLDPNGRQVAQIGYTSSEVVGQSVLLNGDLSAGDAAWGNWDSKSPAPQMQLGSDGSRRWIKLVAGGFSSLFYPGNFSVVDGQWYRLTFDLKTMSPNQKVVVVPRRGGGGDNGYELVTSASQYVLGQPSWNRYTMTFQANKSVNYSDPVTGDAGARIDFQQIRAGEHIFLANVELVPIRKVGSTLRTGLLRNPWSTNLPVTCPLAWTAPTACALTIRFTDGERATWPHSLPARSSEIVYTRDDSLVDSDSDGIADVQDACPGTLAGEASNAAGCAILQ
jgi:parallel beta-helix repeat protein